MTKCQTLRKFWHWTFLKGFTWNLTLSHLLGRTSQKNTLYATHPREFSYLILSSSERGFQPCQGRMYFHALFRPHWAGEPFPLYGVVGNQLSISFSFLVILWAYSETWWPSGNYGTRWEWRSVVHVSVSAQHLILLNRSDSIQKKCNCVEKLYFAQGTSLHPLHWRTGHIKEARGRTIHDADCGQV